VFQLSRVFVSVIIPTHNRSGSLLRTLDSLKRQTLSINDYEVIIIDDGSIDGTENLSWSGYPFRIRCYRQENTGATNARNAGARLSSTELLVFMDDDIVATPGMLESLVKEVAIYDRVIVLGTLIPVSDGPTNPFTDLYCKGAVFPAVVNGLEPRLCGPPQVGAVGCFVHFAQCMTGILAIRQEDFYALDMFQDPTGGWPNWDDVDFGYRAHLAGFRLWRSADVVAFHYDYALKSLEACAARLERISESAARLFQRYPELIEYLPYRDKAPMSILTDSPSLLARKILRNLASGRLSVYAMQRLSSVLEKHEPGSGLLALLYRWILSAYMYKGYRHGLCELADA